MPDQMLHRSYIIERPATPEIEYNYVNCLPESPLMKSSFAWLVSHNIHVYFPSLTLLSLDYLS